MSDDAFWLLAFAMYFADHIKLIEHRDLVINETISLQWQVSLAAIPFEVKRLCVTILNPFTPFLMTFKTRWMSLESVDYRILRENRRLLLRLQKRVLPFRAIASASFIMFFIVGPMLTNRIGLGGTLLVLAPIHVFIIAATISFAMRDNLGFTLRQWIALIVESALCPMYGPSLLKRLSWKTNLTADGLAFAKRYSEIKHLPELAHAAQTRTDDMIESSASETERAEIIKYRDFVHLSA